MTQQDKAAERSVLIMQLGRLLAPVDKLAEQTPPPTPAEYRVAAALLRPDADRWANEVSEFVTVGGYRFEKEYNEIVAGPFTVCGNLSHFARVEDDLPQRQRHLREMLDHQKRETLKAIDRIPIEWEPRLHEAKTPLSVYM